MIKLVIEVKDFVKSFGENDVLKDIIEKVEFGQVIVVIGFFGGGKSIFLCCLNLFEMFISG